MYNFCLVLCELFNDKLHGFDDNSDQSVLGHYLINYNISRMVQENEINSLNDTKAFLKMCNNQNQLNQQNHLVIKLRVQPTAIKHLVKT